ncbi:MAG TPA: methionyl-tRNA formyltransferase [Candidatus Sulfotelmatobacter sp.]|nr:methionyl-tRNA formyltransferase [Candidatus Sulfotelmatobacter sp.]
MKVVFFGSSRFVVPIIEMLHYSTDLALVVTTEQGNMDPVPFFCKTKKIEFISVRKSADLIANSGISQSMAVLGVVADFGLIIPEQTLKSFAFGTINVHPSYLPKYRGPTPVQNAILNGDKKTGLSIISLDKHVDHGPIITQVEEEIKPDDTSKSLYERLFKIGAQSLQKIVTGYENGQVKLTPQKHEEATFTKILNKNDGFFDISRLSTEGELFERMTRAYYPWPGVWAKAKLDENSSEKIVKFLPFWKIQVEGGKEMNYKDFSNGYPKCDKRLLDFLKKHENN